MEPNNEKRPVFKVGDLVATRLKYTHIDEGWTGIVLGTSISELTSLSNVTVLGSDGYVVELSTDLLRIISENR